MRTALVIALALGCNSTESKAPPSPLAATSTSAAPSASPSGSATPSSEDTWVKDRLLAADPRFKGWLKRARELRLQILVSVVTGATTEKPKLESHGFRVDAEYFYPASAIKTFLAVAALHSLSALAKEHGVAIDERTPMRRCADDAGRCEVYPEDKTEKDEDGKFTIAGEIKKLLSYSDNDSYERLFDLVGHREVNEEMARLGFTSVRFHHRMGAPAERSRKSPRLIVFPRAAPAITLAPRTSTFELKPTPAPDLSIGKSYRGERGPVDEPMSFATKNYVPLRDLQRINLSLLFPSAEGAIDLHLTDEQRAVLIGPMSGRLKPRAEAERHKPLLPGIWRVIPDERLRYVAKSGRAYGFHIENAYIEDTETHRAFFVTATIYVNADGVLNDDVYDYDEVSAPFMEALGAALASSLLK